VCHAKIDAATRLIFDNSLLVVIAVLWFEILTRPAGKRACNQGEALKCVVKAL
jgi:hypothetical protein